MRKLAWQALLFGITGGVAGCFLGPFLPPLTAAELILALGGISAISGSLLGWSIGWLSQSRSLIKEIDYEAARHLFRQLGDLQRELIWRWGVVFASSVAVITCAITLKIPDLAPGAFRWLMAGGSALLMIALGFVLYLFQRMLALSALKTSLDEFEHDELRKKRLWASSAMGE
ncbi:MAG: hypothetical protein JJT96_07130 [Opitutales bacterium]|nr:hypothetical protein [Opitutales bacterium]